MTDFVCWLDEDDDDTIARLLPDRIPALDGQGYRLREAGSCADWFPRDLVIPTWDPTPPPKNRRPSLYNPYPGYGDRMTDMLPNVFGWLVVSPRLKAFLEQEISPEEIEFLPIHVKRAERVLPYFIAHPLLATECIDLEKTEGRASAILPDNYFRIKHLVLDPSGFPPGARFFRAARYPDLVLIDTVLAQTMVDDDHEGGLFCFAEDFGDSWLSDIPKEDWVKR